MRLLAVLVLPLLVAMPADGAETLAAEAYPVQREALVEAVRAGLRDEDPARNAVALLTVAEVRLREAIPDVVRILVVAPEPAEPADTTRDPRLTHLGSFAADALIACGQPAPEAAVDATLRLGLRAETVILAARAPEAHRRTLLELARGKPYDLAWLAACELLARRPSAELVEALWPLLQPTLTVVLREPGNSRLGIGPLCGGVRGGYEQSCHPELPTMVAYELWDPEAGATILLTGSRAIAWQRHEGPLVRVRQHSGVDAAASSAELLARVVGWPARAVTGTSLAFELARDGDPVAVLVGMRSARDGIVAELTTLAADLGQRGFAIPVASPPASLVRIAIVDRREGATPLPPLDAATEP